MTIQLQLEQKHSMYISLVLISAIMLVLTPGVCTRFALRKFFFSFFPFFSPFFWLDHQHGKIASHGNVFALVVYFTSLHAGEPTFSRLCKPYCLPFYVFASNKLHTTRVTITWATHYCPPNPKL